jgi:hypothetical protein
MRAANHKRSGRRRLLLLATTVLATAVTAAVAIPWASSASLFPTGTSMTVTDAQGNALPTDSSGNLQIAIGQSVTVTAFVSDSQGVAPQGTVTFKSNISGSFVAFATVNLAATGSNTASATTTTTFSQGNYQLEAVYNGSMSQLLATSTSATVPVSTATTTPYNTGTQVSVNPSTINLNDSTTVTATITPGDPTAPAPTGTVTFSAAGSGAYNANLGQVALVPDANDNSSTATITPTFGRADTYTIEADYQGIIYNGTSNVRIQFFRSSGTAMLTVLSNPAKTPTITTLTPLPRSIRSGASVELIGHVSQSGGPLNSNDGVVRFYVATTANTDNPIFAGQANLDDNGDAIVSVPNSIYTSAWLPGTYVLTATYVGNTFYQASSGSAQLLVNQAVNSRTTVPNFHTYVGDPITLFATSTDANSPTTPVTDGDLTSLTASDPSNTTCTAATVGGVASCITTFLNAGTFTLDGDYLGGPVYNPSSGVGTVVVDKVPTEDTVTPTPNPAPQNSTVTLSGHLIDTLHTGHPPIAGATITLALNGNRSETCTAKTNANGDGSCTVTVSESPGTYPVSVSYAGDYKYLPSDNTNTLQVVGALHTSWKYLGDTSVLAGHPALIKFQLTDELGRVMGSRPVTLTLPDGSTYSTTTDANGYASKTVTPTTPGTYTPQAQFGDGSSTDLAEPGYYGSTGTGTLVVQTIPTQWTYLGDTSVNGGAQTHVTFQLTDKTSGQPLAGMPVTLTLIDGSTFSTTTDANGIATKTVTAPTPSAATTYPVSAHFSGQLPYLASDGTGSVRVVAIPTTVTYVGDTTVVQGNTATLAAKLVDPNGNPLPNETLTLTMSTGESCSGITNAQGIASCPVVVNEATTLAGSPYPIAIAFGGDLPYLPSNGLGAIAVTAPYQAPAAGFCSGNKCESIIANPTVVSPTHLQVLYTDDSPLPTTPSLAPTAVLDGGQQLYVTVTPTSGQTPSYVDTYGGSTATRYQDFIDVKVPSGLAPGNHTIRVFINDGDGDWDQWTWTINVGSNGTIGTVNPGPGPVSCTAVKCESLLADPAVVSSSQLSIVAMDDSPIVVAGAKAPSATLNGQALSVSTSATSGQPQNYVNSTGGSLATTYQTLIAINLPANLAPGTYSILVTAYDGDGDLDQWGWPITVASNGTVTSNWTAGGGSTGMISKASSITANFSNTVDAGSTLWLTSSTKVSGLPATGATITFTNQTVTIGTTTIALPDAEVAYSPTATAATTDWDAADNEWETVVPKSLGGNVFASGLAYAVPAAIGKVSVTWSATVSSDTPGVTVAWQWAAAEYTGFGSDPSLLGVKPCDDGKKSAYQNPDHAGTPENYKTLVVPGGTGGGGSNYTGKNTPSTSIKF